MIEVDNLRRVYEIRQSVLPWRTKRQVHALHGISFQIPPGELFGILGPNGAGKTTTIRILSTLLMPTGGVARVLGLNVVTDAPRIRSQIGFVFGGERGLYGRVTTMQNLRYFANLYGMDAATMRRRIPQVLEEVGLTDRADTRVETLSRGLKQRLHIARALLHDPAIVFMDEPTIGIDPAAAHGLRQLILRLKAAGKTILLTTHYIYEADQLCDRVAVLKEGRIVTLDTPERLRAGTADRLLAMEIILYADDPHLLRRLQALPIVESCTRVEKDGTQIMILQCRGGRESLPAIAEELVGVRHGGMIVREPTLEDAYLRILGSHGQGPDGVKAGGT